MGETGHMQLPHKWMNETCQEDSLILIFENLTLEILILATVFYMSET